MWGELGLAAEGIAAYSMPLNIATTQGDSNIPTKSAAIRRLCIGSSSALPERGALPTLPESAHGAIFPIPLQ
jgi:hypothetical protein